MEVKKVAVVGSGQVGTTIANVWLQNGYPVIIRDIAEPILKKAHDNIEGSLQRRVTSGGLTPAQKEETLNRLKTTTNLSDLKDMDLVVEAVPENIAVKKSVFAELDAICSEKTILCTNSTALPITKIASATKRPAKCAVMHFMYPAQVIRHIELARGYLTSDDTWETVKKLTKELGGKPITIKKDYQGSNAYLKIEMPPPYAAWMEPYWDLMLGKVTLEELEARPKGTENLPWMEMEDFIGLDTRLGMAEADFEEYALPGFHPCPLLQRMVDARHLGQKTGIGFYDYSESPRKAIPGKFSPYLVRFLAKEEDVLT